MDLRTRTFRADCTDKEQAVKVLEEAAEMYAEWQTFSRMCDDALEYPEGEHWGFNRAIDEAEYSFGTEIADVIIAACNLADRFGMDLQSYIDECERKNERRGRYAGDGGAPQDK